MKLLIWKYNSIINQKKIKMTPNQKLNYLLDKLYYLNSFKKKHIAISLIIDESINECYNFDTMDRCKERIDFWQQVKKELEKL